MRGFGWSSIPLFLYFKQTIIWKKFTRLSGISGEFPSLYLSGLKRRGEKCDSIINLLLLKNESLCCLPAKTYIIVSTKFRLFNLLKRILPGLDQYIFYVMQYCCVKSVFATGIQFLQLPLHEGVCSLSHQFINNGDTHDSKILSVVNEKSCPVKVIKYILAQKNQMFRIEF